MKKILLLGSGELGKEFVIAAKRLGQYVIACDKYDDAPAMQVADERDVFDMLDAEQLEAAIKKHNPDIIVPEIEAIRTEVLYKAEADGIQVVPSAKAVNYTMNRKSIRELATSLGLKTAKYRYAASFDELKEAVNEIGTPFIIKPLMSSSGHGQSLVSGDDELTLTDAWNYAMIESRGDIKEVIVEEYIPFDYEITLLTVTQKCGPTLFCKPIWHEQKHGDYQRSYQPANMPDELIQRAEIMADRITKELTGYGIWGVEFFIKDNEVIFSELSPRPHDTGMVTLANTQNLNEFELHARAVLGYPIPAIIQRHAGVSKVILANKVSDNPEYEGIEDALSYYNVDIRIFGKKATKVGRRMGVVVSSIEKDKFDETTFAATMNLCTNLGNNIKIRE